MDSEYKIYLERAQNELNLAKIIFQISGDTSIQINIFKITRTESFYSAVISHAYYCIFYAAKAYLMKKGIKTKPPEEHKKTYDEFKKLVEAGIIDSELLRLYEEIMVRADILLGIFKIEKKKRGKFTYQKLSQANLEPARESSENAKNFFRHMYNLCEQTTAAETD